MYNPKKYQQNALENMFQHSKILVFFSFLYFVLYTGILQGQTITQTIRGKIIDLDSQSPLPGANVVVLDSETFLGASTASDGTFRIDNVPVGRVSLSITFVGYENKTIPNLLITSGKETILEIALKESFLTMDEIVVTAGKDKSEVANEMALISARGFTVEETKRMAGSFNDPARMASGYAGVDTEASGDNSIIVRGNSPKGIQWRLEGIDIPSPNHFSDEGATGGPINALNSHMLANSEFYTGAFPAEYGNALSGVFDMKLRKGNNEKREYSFSIGALGTDATIEGPFKKGGKSSYLVNYRYSTLSLLDNLGVVDFDGVPKYQDVSFKFNFPTKSLGTFSLFGLGGKSNILTEETDEENEEIVLEEGDYKANVGVVGITQMWPLGSKTYLQNSISASQNGSGLEAFEPDNMNNMVSRTDLHLNKNSLKVASTLNHKFNSRNSLQGGLIYTKLNFDFYNEYYDAEIDQLVNDQNMKGDADQGQGFVSWKFRPTENLSLVTGIHAQKLSLMDAVSIEPRASVRWQFHPLKALTAGFGIHGKAESLTNYFSIIPSENGSPLMPNKTMGFSKAQHYVIGYENKIGDNLFLKVEGYYQYLYDIPVENDETSSYSLINQLDGFTDRVLVNKGTGENLGIELTLERYFADNYYFLATTSLFDSKYAALDGVERNTLFNGNYIGNFLFGKEFKLNSKKQRNKVFGINSKITLSGAKRFTPIDLEASTAKDETVFVEDQAFSIKGDPIFIANVALSYRVDHKRISQEFKIDIQNATNNAAKLTHYYNKFTNKVESITQLSLLPVFIYTINF